MSQSKKYNTEAPRHAGDFFQAGTRTQGNFKLTPKDLAPVSKKPSMTMQGQETSIEEILKRHAMGMPIQTRQGLEGLAESLDDIDIEKTLRSNQIDLYSAQQILKTKIDDLNERIKINNDSPIKQMPTEGEASTEINSTVLDEGGRPRAKG